MLPDELPEGWALTTLKHIAELEMGQSPPGSATNDAGKGVPLIGGAADIYDGKLVASRHTTEPTKLSRDGDLVLCIRATIGKSAFADGVYCLGRGVAGLRAFGTEPRWLQAYLLHSEEQLASKGTGTTFKQVSKSILEAHEVKLPPLAEQRRIVAKLDALEERRRAIKARLDRLPGLLERYRQSVLAAAFRGDLTVGWRQRHPDTEPAEVLLEKIRAERRRRWVEAEAEKATQRAEACADKQGHPWDEATRAARLAQERTKAEKKYRAPEPVDATDLPDLPDGWCWASVEELAHVGTGATPKRGNPTFWQDGSIPWVTSGAVNEGMVSEPSGHVTAAALSQTNLTLYPPGTLLIAMYGEGRTRGMCAELTFESTTNQALAALVLEDTAKLLRSWLISFFEKNYLHIRRLSAGGVQPNLNLGLIRSLPVPLPPLDEQEVANGLVRSALAGYSSCVAVVEASQRKLDMLHQATLARAFRGELVPTEAELARREGRDYEHAEALLARVRAERNGRPKPTQRRAKRGSGPTPPSTEGDGHEEPPIAFRMNASGAPVRVDPGGQGRLDL